MLVVPFCNPSTHTRTSNQTGRIKINEEAKNPNSNALLLVCAATTAEAMGIGQGKAQRKGLKEEDSSANGISFSFEEPMQVA
jgi:hypothetical protein